MSELACSIETNETCTATGGSGIQIIRKYFIAGSADIVQQFIDSGHHRILLVHSMAGETSRRTGDTCSILALLKVHSG